MASFSACSAGSAWRWNFRNPAIEMTENTIRLLANHNWHRLCRLFCPAWICRRFSSSVPPLSHWSRCCRQILGYSESWWTRLHVDSDDFPYLYLPPQELNKVYLECFCFLFASFSPRPLIACILQPSKCEILHHVSRCFCLQILWHFQKISSRSVLNLPRKNGYWLVLCWRRWGKRHLQCL